MPPKRKKNIRITRVKKRKVTKLKKIVKLEVKEENIIESVDKPICGICNGGFDYDDAVNGQTKVCKCQKYLGKLEGKKTLKCKKCPKLFKFEKNYIKHCLNEHSKTPGSVSCAQCHVSCPNKKILRKHIENTHNRKEFRCPKCAKTFVRHAHVLRHLAQSGCDGTPAASYPCEICNSTFSRKDNLMVHLRFQHILNNTYSCKHVSCNYQTKNFSKLIKHWLYNHNANLKFECDICGKLTSSRTSMAKHLEIHGEKKYICNTCGYSTFTAEVLKRHALTHVQEKPHKCEICGQSYIQRLQLKRHLERHLSNTCSTCGQKFNTKARLVIHERTHLGLDRLVCPYQSCPSSSKEFINELSLHAHVQGHLNQKKFPCEVCGKQYFSEVNMRRHLSTHRLDKPRRCMYCVTARAYIRGEQLVRHVRHHHPDMFSTHLAHVRQVMGTNIAIDRVKKTELESILTLLDAESERILEGYGGSGVLYGGMQEESATGTTVTATEVPIKYEPSPLMSEEELEENLKKLLSQLIDQDTLECFGWPDESIDAVLEKVVVQCGARAADRARWTRVQCLRENTKHLFLYAVEDKHIARMLDTHTIDQIVLHILDQVADE